MADNAIMVRRQGGGDGGGAKITVDFLEDYAARLNRMNFTRGQGIHWFVNKREVPGTDGEEVCFLDSRPAFVGNDSPKAPVRRAVANLRAPYADP